MGTMEVNDISLRFGGLVALNSASGSINKVIEQTIPHVLDTAYVYVLKVRNMVASGPPERFPELRFLMELF